MNETLINNVDVMNETLKIMIQFDGTDRPTNKMNELSYEQTVEPAVVRNLA